VAAARAGAPLRFADYCGFLTLDEARQARERLRERGIRSEIVVREAPGVAATEPLSEEHWLRVETSRLGDVAGILGDEPEPDPEPSDPGGQPGPGYACGDCGAAVGERETSCPGCGARFDP
jgi:hypothetical protein